MDYHSPVKLHSCCRRMVILHNLPSYFVKKSMYFKCFCVIFSVTCVIYCNFMYFPFLTNQIASLKSYAVNYFFQMFLCSFTQVRNCAISRRVTILLLLRKIMQKYLKNIFLHSKCVIYFRPAIR